MRKTISNIPRTEGIKYAGSKLRLLPHILEEVSVLDVHTVLDAFSGTTRVAQAFAQTGYETTANDISEWSEVFGTCYLKSGMDDSYYQEIIDMLNSLEGYDGWFTEHYGGNDETGKKPFQRHNTRKLDAIRDKIDTLGLPWVDKCVLLTSLILALDSVDNTLGHFASYLSGWAPRSYRTMKLKMPQRFPLTTGNTVLKGDIFSALDRHYDLIYFDPPYGSNNEKMPPSRVRYASYYHIWKTVILNDKPAVFGKAGRREDSKDTVSASVFEDYRKDGNGKHVAMQAIDRLIEKADARYILLSYSSGGRATRDELADIMNSHGRLLHVSEIDYRKNVMSRLSWTEKWLNDYGPNKEFLFLMEK